MTLEQHGQAKRSILKNICPRACSADLSNFMSFQPNGSVLLNKEDRSFVRRGSGPNKSSIEISIVLRFLLINFLRASCLADNSK